MWFNRSLKWNLGPQVALLIVLLLPGCNMGQLKQNSNPNQNDVFVNFEIMDQEGGWPSIYAETLFTNLSNNNYNSYTQASSGFFPNPVVSLGKNDAISASINNGGQVTLKQGSIVPFEITYLYTYPNPNNLILPNSNSYQFYLTYKGNSFSQRYASLPSVYTINISNNPIACFNPGTAVTCSVTTTNKVPNHALATIAYTLSNANSRCIAQNSAITQNSTIDVVTFNSCPLSPGGGYTLQLNITQNMNNVVQGNMHLQGQYYFVSRGVAATIYPN